MNLYLCSESGPAEPPTSYLWSLYLSAQHYNRIGQSLKALELIDAAIEHTPTEVQLYILKAKILKVRGGLFSDHVANNVGENFWVCEVHVAGKSQLYVQHATLLCECALLRCACVAFCMSFLPLFVRQAFIS